MSNQWSAVLIMRALTRVSKYKWVSCVPQLPSPSNHIMPLTLVSRADSSESDESFNTALQAPDGLSLYSWVSSEDGTLHTTTDYNSGVNAKDLKLDLTAPRYLDVRFQHKSLPSLPQTARYFEGEKQHGLYDYDPYAQQRINSSPQPRIVAIPEQAPTSFSHPLTATHQLASALGPDNVPHGAELDSIPCAGVRIPHGQLLGQIAWRLVVRVPTTTRGKRDWWEDKEGKGTYAAKWARRSSSANILGGFGDIDHLAPPRFPPPRPTHSHSHSEWAVPHRGSISAVSLPLRKSDSSRSLTRSRHVHGRQGNGHGQRHPRHDNPYAPPTTAPPPSGPQTSCVTNFILDTSLPYSIISRETLVVLGYPASQLPSPLNPASNPHSDPDPDCKDVPSVTLSIQGISTCLRIARPGEASRLGVQFLHDAGVSVFFPRNGEGLGPVLYGEFFTFLAPDQTTDY